MGLGKDSANWFISGIIGIVKVIFVFGLVILIGYFGYKFLSANYGTHPYFPHIVAGFMLGDFIFCVIVERFLDQVLLKGKY